MSRRVRSAALACAAAFAALAVLVSAGALTGADQWWIDHAPPGARFGGAEPSLVEAAVPLLHEKIDTVVQAAVDIVGLPASALVSFLIVAWCCVRLRSPVWLLVWVGATAVELLCREIVTRPALRLGATHLEGFDDSFPSGHTLRALVVASAVGAVWPRARRFAFAWAFLVAALVLAAGWHVPSDVAGGLVLAALALVCARSG